MKKTFLIIFCFLFMCNTLLADDKNDAKMMIKSKIDSLKKNNRILSLKHAELKFWHDFVQITTIILSTLLTFIESIKNELNFDTSGYIITQKIWSLIPIFFSTIILSKFVLIIILVFTINFIPFFFALKVKS